MIMFFTGFAIAAIIGGSIWIIKTANEVREINDYLRHQ